MSVTTVSSTTKTYGISAETEKTMAIGFGWIRGLSGLLFLILGIIGSIWGCFKENDHDDDEEEEDIITTAK